MLIRLLDGQTTCFGDISDKNEMKFNFLMNFRNSQFSFFIPWISIEPGHFHLKSRIESLTVPPVIFVDN